MTRFDECLAFVLEREGGYVNNPHDHGGATNKGITQRVYDEWSERKGLPKGSVQFIPDDAVAQIYNEQYWQPVRGPVLPAPLDMVLFDSAVQHGAGRSIKWLQQLVGTVCDGEFGQMTRVALSRFIEQYGIDELVARYLKRRDAFYQHIVDSDPTQKVFEKGWDNRMAHLRDAVMA